MAPVLAFWIGERRTYLAQKITLEHSSGSKKDRWEEYTLQPNDELLLGRDPSCHVQYNLYDDDLVSRRHARIAYEKGTGNQFTLSDLGSRNGTLLNRQLVEGTVPLNPGDVIRLGPCGPEFRLHVGTKRSQRKLVMQVAAIVLALGLTASATALLRNKTNVPQMRRPLTLDSITSTYSSTVAQVESDWTLLDTSSGSIIYQEYRPNRIPSEYDDDLPLIYGADNNLPVFIEKDGRLEPLLTIDSANGRNKPIGKTFRGQGTFTSKDGTLLVSTLNAEPWRVAYRWKASATGLLAQLDEQGEATRLTPLQYGSFPKDWIPVQSKWKDRALDGRMDQIAVKLGARQWPARVQMNHPFKGVALLKVNVEDGVQPADLYDNVEALNPPQPAYVLHSANELIIQPASLHGAMRVRDRLVLNLSPVAAPAGSPILDEQGRVIGLLSGKEEALPIRNGIEMIGR